MPDMRNTLILIFVYGSWGSELHSTADTLEAAKAVALKASAADPKNEYCVEIDPGGPDSPLYKGGVQIGGAR